MGPNLATAIILVHAKQMKGRNDESFLTVQNEAKFSYGAEFTGVEHEYLVEMLIPIFLGNDNLREFSGPV